MTSKGAADYSALARHMDTVYLAEIPCMSVVVSELDSCGRRCHICSQFNLLSSSQDHDRSRRFITLVDELYDAEKALKWTSEKEVSDLFSFITEEVGRYQYQYMCPPLVGCLWMMQSSA